MLSIRCINLGTRCAFVSGIILSSNSNKVLSSEKLFPAIMLPVNFPTCHYMFVAWAVIIIRRLLCICIVRSRIAAYCKIGVCCTDTLHCVRNCVTRAMYLANCKIWESAGNVRKGHTYIPQVDFRKKCILRGNYLRCHFLYERVFYEYTYIFHKYLFKIYFLREVDSRFKFL